MQQRPQLFYGVIGVQVPYVVDAGGALYARRYELLVALCMYYIALTQGNVVYEQRLPGTTSLKD